SEKCNHGSDILGLSEASERGLRDHLLFKIASRKPQGMKPFGLNSPWIDRVDPDFSRAELLGQRLGYCIDGSFGPGVDCVVRRRHRARDRTDIDQVAALGSKMVHRFLRCQNQTEHIRIELAMKLTLRHLFER